MRLFTAIDIPDELRDQLSALPVEDLPSARQTSPEQWHVTLRFIGEVDEAQAVRYRDALADVKVDAVQCQPLEPSALGVLPSRRSPRVIMLELQKTDSLLSLYKAVSETLEAEGLNPEDRTYRPHVTVARLNDANPERVHTFLRDHEDHSFPSFQVTKFTLYESTLTPDGAVHEPFAVYDLPH